MVKQVDPETAARHDADIAEWFAKFGNQPEPPHAEFVEIDHERRLLILNMSDGHRVVLPLEDIQGLAFASPAQLDEFELLGRGTGMDWPSLGVSFTVSGLLEGSYGNRLWMQMLRRRGGAAKSEAKAAAARANGAKGGRPRKEKVPA